MEKQLYYVVYNLLVCSLFLVATSIGHEEFVQESKSYWKIRGEEAMKHNLEAYNPNPFNVTNHINHRAKTLIENGGINTTTGRLMAEKYHGPCKYTNPIDACWRCDPDWEKNRKRLAHCALGFATGTVGGKYGKRYVVNDSSDDDMVNPKPGTLRYAVIQDEPLWIVFSASMTIMLSQELIMNSHKTIDGRGAHVVIEGGAQITIQNVRNIIIHGIKIRNLIPEIGGMIRDSVSHYGFRVRSDGDGISVLGSNHIWIDHVSLTNCSDGLIDVIDGSTAITISNCHMAKHDAVFLFGANRSHEHDVIMQVTVAYNLFGKELVQRMPRCRRGFFHVVNNDYTHWRKYAMGGSEHPTVMSQGNRFIAHDDPRTKEVTHSELPLTPWNIGNWRSENDFLLNGATFKESGSDINIKDFGNNIIKSVPGTQAAEMSMFAGPLKCIPKLPC